MFEKPSETPGNAVEVDVVQGSDHTMNSGPSQDPSTVKSGAEAGGVTEPAGDQAYNVHLDAKKANAMSGLSIILTLTSIVVAFA